MTSRTPGGSAPREGHVELPGATVGWCEWGEPAGRPVVFLHGTPGSRLFFPDTALRRASRAGVLTFDRPGYGRSTPLKVPSLLGVAQIVGRLADHHGLERFAVVGFSGGGPAALACAEIARRIPSCAVHAAADAGHWLLISRWPDILARSLS